MPVIVKSEIEPLKFKSYLYGDELSIGRYGVREPIKKESFYLDIIFVPCLAYDKYGFRLGYGGGYYDKTISYLHLINHKFLSVGLAYDDQKINKVVCDHFDQRLDYILTEKQLYKILWK